MRTRIIDTLLAILNSRWINATPCSYGHVNGLDAMSYEALASEDRQQPGITVREVLVTIDRFKSCSTRSGLTVIDGEDVREATAWDVHELNQAFQPKEGTK